MNDQTLFRRIAAISAILSGPMALASFYVVSLAVAFDFELMNDTAALVSLGAGAAKVFRWAKSWVHLVTTCCLCLRRFFSTAGSVRRAPT